MWLQSCGVPPCSQTNVFFAEHHVAMWRDDLWPFDNIITRSVLTFVLFLLQILNKFLNYSGDLRPSTCVFILSPSNVRRNSFDVDTIVCLFFTNSLLHYVRLFPGMYEVHPNPLWATQTHTNTKRTEEVDPSLDDTVCAWSLNKRDGWKSK